MHYASLVVMISDASGQHKEILIMKRSKDSGSYPGCWALPGGKIEVGETPVDAAVRETKEETNLEVKGGDLISFYLMTKGSKDYSCFITTDWSGELKLSSEHDDFKWVSYKDLHNHIEIPTSINFFLALNKILDKI